MRRSLTATYAWSPTRRARVKTPTLLLRRPAHPLSPARADDPIIELVPGATRVDLPGTDLSVLGGEVDALIGEIARFVTGEHHPPAPARELVAVLCTDLVASTAGVRRNSATHVGSVCSIDTTRFPDRVSGGAAAPSSKRWETGFLQRSRRRRTHYAPHKTSAAGLRAEGFEVRAGIHVGDVDRRGDDISGINVVIAVRLLDLARRGEIIVSNTALAAIGDSVPVESRGSHHLKGVQGSWTVYATTDG